MAEQTRVYNYLKHCQSWQRVINSQSSTDAKRNSLIDAFTELKGLDFYGTRKVIVHGEGVLQIPDGTSQLEESIRPWMGFQEVITKGWLGRLYAIQQPEEITITWPIYDAHVLGPIQDEEMPVDPGAFEAEEIVHPLVIDQRLNRPLHFPVGLIDFAVCYAT